MVTWIISVRFPYSPGKEKFSKVFMRKVETFTNDKVKVIIIWNTRKIQPLFNNKNFIYLFFYLYINLFKTYDVRGVFHKTCQISVNNQINNDVLNLFSNNVVTENYLFYLSWIYFNCFLMSKSNLYIQKYFVYMRMIFTI